MFRSVRALARSWKVPLVCRASPHQLAAPGLSFGQRHVSQPSSIVRSSETRANSRLPSGGGRVETRAGCVVISRARLSPSRDRRCPRTPRRPARSRPARASRREGTPDRRNGVVDSARPAPPRDRSRRPRTGARGPSGGSPWRRCAPPAAVCSGGTTRSAADGSSRSARGRAPVRLPSEARSGT